MMRAMPGAETLLDGLRVLDFSDEIAGPYATKLLADAGADVVKVEALTGDPLREWSASRTDLDGRDGALFRFLNASKRGHTGEPAATLLAGADLVVETGALSFDDIDRLRTAHPRLVVVSISPFGKTGPWADRPATEFTLQAWCGSTASRAEPTRPPLHAGGRLGEWITGTYAAAAALGAVRAKGGDFVDVSMLECMAITLGGAYAGLYASFMGVLEASATFPGPFRMAEAPSIEPTADGLVGFATVTGQQFEDFLLLVERPDLRGDERFSTAPRRSNHLDEFREIVHAWTTKRTTAEAIEQASLLRLPVAPVGTPETVTGFDQFVERAAFVESADGDFVHPRPPYRVSGAQHPVPTPAPALGASGAAWLERAGSPPRPGPVGRPLDGIRIVDFTAFWAGPSATHLLAALGADVVKVESVQRPDGLRFNATKKPGDDGWWEWSPLFHAVNTNKRGVTLDLNREEGRNLVLELIVQADGVMENFTPRVLDDFGITWDVIRERNPRAIFVRMPAFGLSGPWRDRTGFAQTMEQTSGMAWVSGFVDGPPVIPRGACDPLAGTHAAFAFLAALARRERVGDGALVESTMIEAALNAAAELVIEWSAYGVSLHRDGNRGPVAAPQGVYATNATERWLALAVANDDQWTALRSVLGDPAWARMTALTTVTGRRAAHDEIDERLWTWAAEQSLDDAVERLLSAGVPAAPVLGAAAVLGLEPLRARGFVEGVEHPLVGTHPHLTMPFRFASRGDQRWVDRPAPTLGQHNAEVLGQHRDGAGLERLTAERVIGDRPVG